MKIIKYICVASLLFSSCQDLDLNPLSEATNENWFNDEKEITMSVNAMYSLGFWEGVEDNWTDNEASRTSGTSFVFGTLTGQDGKVSNMWKNSYTAIARANTVIQKIENLQEGILSEEKKNQFLGELLCTRASMYARLTFHFGDVPLVVEPIDIDAAFQMGRTPKAEVMKQIYEDFDRAISYLNVKKGSVVRITKGAALALKARTALFNHDYQLAADAAKQCIELDYYRLYPDFEKLFYPATKNSEESIFAIPRSLSDGVSIYRFHTLERMPRNFGGWASYTPTWDLLASYECIDGLPIDESPLFDPHDPFKNRDPRCGMTIVPFNSVFLGVTYAPHPDSVKVRDYNTGELIANKDNKSYTQHASYTGLLWKKGFDETCKLNGSRIDPEMTVVRYADVLLMYAEAMIELNKIDQSVLDAINQVRARAYKVEVSDISSYPAVTATSQSELRTIVRTERRMEFAREDSRYYDLIRWGIADKSLTMKNYGILYPVDELYDRVVNKGLWFWAKAPKIDENGSADFTELEQMGLVNVLSQRSFNKRQYLWPIPTKDILINENMTQNPGY